MRSLHIAAFSSMAYRQCPVWRVRSSGTLQPLLYTKQLVSTTTCLTIYLHKYSQPFSWQTSNSVKPVFVFIQCFCSLRSPLSVPAICIFSSRYFAHSERNALCSIFIKVEVLNGQHMLFCLLQRRNTNSRSACTFFGLHTFDLPLVNSIVFIAYLC